MDYLVFAFGISLIINIIQLILQIRKKPVLNVDAKRLLHDLTKGPAVLRVEVLDASQLLYRSPRG